MISRRYIVFVFIIGLIVRVAFMFTPGNSPIIGDSQMYLNIATGIVETGEYNKKLGNKFIPESERVPVYPYFLAFFKYVFGDNLIFPILAQCLLDSIACVIIGLISARFKPQFFLVAGLLATLNLNMIVHSTLILADSLFLFIISLYMLTVCRHIENPSINMVLLLGALFGIGTLTRPLLMYFAPIMMWTAYAASHHRVPSWRSRIKYPLFSAAIALLIVSPFIIRNYIVFDHAALISQTGTATLNWYVPLTMELNKGIERKAALEESKKRVQSKLDKQGLGELPRNPFERSAFETSVAKEMLLEQGIVAITKAWLIGSVVNLMSPSLTSASAIVNMERPRFYDTPGDNIFDKILNFILHKDNRLYMFLMIPAILITLSLRIIFVMSLWEVAPRAFCHVALYCFVPFFFYVLAVTGPLMSASRYRLPLEPMFIVGVAIGLIYFKEKVLTRKDGLETSNKEVRTNVEGKEKDFIRRSKKQSFWA